MWRLSQVQELVVRPAIGAKRVVEMHFTNCKSMLLRFGSASDLETFVHTLGGKVEKRLLTSVRIVLQSPQFLEDNKLVEGWVKCKLRNVDYLACLNKYAGRSYHDVSFYPVFPSIIWPPVNATSGSQAKEGNRGSGKSAPKIAQAQLQPPRGLPALGCLGLLEPYATARLAADAEQHSARKESGTEGSKQAWQSDEHDSLLELLVMPCSGANFNQYSMAELRDLRIPSWARDAHHFVQQNSLALESIQISGMLPSWIDEMFGVSGANPRSSPSDNQNVPTGLEGRIETVPLFTLRHPGRAETEVDRRVKRSFFPQDGCEEGQKYARQFAAAFEYHTVTHIEAFEKRLLVVLSGKVVRRSKEKYLNVANEKGLLFDIKETALFPHVTPEPDTLGKLHCDQRRLYASLENGQYILTCRHHDSSCRLLNCSDGSIVQHLGLHKVLDGSKW